MDEYEKSVSGTKRYHIAREMLKAVFGYDTFKPDQYKIIDNILNEVDVLAIMPTGYGKSLCFQIVPLLTGEVAIVISPLIALMADQKMILDDLGITSCCYNSTKSQKEKLEIEKDLINGKYQILYITPESLVKCNKLIDDIYTSQGICMVAIDEAHCLSSYGFDFRPKYRELYKVRKYLTNVPILAVTATATHKVAEDILKIMQMDNAVMIKTSFDRPNLRINVKLQSQNTMDDIIDSLEKSDGPSIVYCVTKSDTDMISDKLNSSNISAKPYHAGLTNKIRQKTQEEFMNGKYNCIVATIAFGMGINKRDIRTIVHYGCPQNIESYYQEIGRAGRDNKRSDCYLYYKEKDFIIQKMFINHIKDPRYKTVRNSLLHTMSQYVNTNECRRKFILKYFGQEYKKNTCNKCDNCTAEKKIISKHNEHKLFQVLSTVLQIRSSYNISYGISTIALILKGSGSKKIKDWMKKMIYYGGMRGDTIKDINSFIHKTIELNYIEQYDIGNCVHVMRCTTQGLIFGKEYEVKLNLNDTSKNKIINKKMEKWFLV